MHIGLLTINGEKMSKSIGNILTLKEIFKDWHPEAIRLFLLSSHYRSPVDFSFEALSEVKIDEVLKNAATVAVAAPAAPAAAPSGPGQPKAEAKDDKKKEEEALAGLSALFG
jgi:cysteinyl-tRNA synthetase